MAEKKYYVLCESGCKYESMTKEQIYAAIAQAVETGKITDCDAGFITTLKTINGAALRFFVGKQSEYEALTDAQKENLFAIITNDTIKEGFEDTLNGLQMTLDGVSGNVTELNGKTSDNAKRIGNLENKCAFMSNTPSLVVSGETVVTEAGYYAAYAQSKTGGVRYSCGVGYWSKGNETKLYDAYSKVQVDIHSDGKVWCGTEYDVYMQKLWG